MKKIASFMIDPVLHEKGKKLAKENGLSFSTFLAFLILNYEKSQLRGDKNWNPS